FGVQIYVDDECQVVPSGSVATTYVDHVDITVYYTGGVDSTPPNITINGPTATCSQSNSITFNTTASDDTAMDSCWYTLNGGIDNFTMSNAGTDWTATNTSMAEGSHTVNIYCNDSGGNINNSQSVNFSIDTTPPTASVTSPSNASSSTSTGLDVEFNATGADSCKWTDDAGGTNSSLIATENITNITWGEGDHTISVYCIDSCGNEASDSISFTINSCSVVAGVSIDSPSANSCSNSAGLDVTYLLTGTSPDSCWWTSNSGGLNSSLTTAGDNITSETWSEGAHTVDVYCNDSCGNEASDSVTFTTDLTSPTATFTCTPGTLTISAVETCACTPTDNAGGCGIDNTATSFTLNPSTAVAGTLTETCTFADLAGNTGSATASYIVEGGGPDPGCCGGGGGGGGGSTPKHCECSEENKCVSVSGEGKDECDFDEDCEGEPELVFEQDSYEFDVNKKVAKFYMILKNIGDAVAENIKVDASDLGLNFPDKLVSVKIEKTTLEPDEETNVIVLVDLTSYDLEKEPILIFNKENILFNKVDDKATYTLILKNIGNIVAENIKVDISSLGLNVPDELVSVEIDKTSLEPEEETKVFVTIDLSDYEGNLEVNSNGITGFSISDLKVSSDRITGFNIDNLKVTEDSREVDAMILGMKIKKKSLFDDLLFLYSLLVFDLLLISLLFHYYGRKRLVYVENKRREEGNKKDE
ncbi:MAG: Ig-like domain-containing protein, partial [archaeon]